MGRGSVAQAALLQHACWDPPSSKLSCKAVTNLRSRSSSSASSRSRAALVVVSNHHKSRRDYNKDQNNSAQCTLLRGPILPSCSVRPYWRTHSASSIASSFTFSSASSSPSLVSAFGSPSASSRGHRALNFNGGQYGRSLTLGGSGLTKWSSVNAVSSKGFVGWSNRTWSLDSSGGFRVGPKRKFCQGRAELEVMAVSAAAPEGYRRNVGLCVVNQKDEVFVASRLDIPESWQMPQGGVDDGEDPRHAAIRELREETGITSVQLIGEVQEWLTYDFPPDVKTKLTELWGTEWKGQAQKWFLFRFDGDDSEINLQGDGSEPPEFGDWKWSPAEEVLKLAVDFKKPVYTLAFKSLSGFIDSWSKL